ncbi:MFS transporter [Phreatobacter sp.]|uniref:MFS transporter n=1 Tax=Phreatobacter sp. TaxID=1966341 RepID=UPI003F6FC840
MKPEASAHSALSQGFVIALVATLAAATAISQFYRNSVGVIATTLTDDLQLTADQLGSIASSFFLIFALCQIPVGIAIDRYGPRRTMLGSLAFVVAGSVLFAMATGPAGLIGGRLLLGIGCSTFLMAPLAIYARAFRPEAFATLAGVQVAISNLGTLGATAPLAWATASYGWRPAFLAAALFALALALALALMLRPAFAGPAAGGAKESLADALRGVREVTRLPGIWPLFLMSFSAYSSFGLIIGLWGGPYLAHVHGADLGLQGHALLLMALAQIGGSLMWGMSDRLMRAYRPMVVIAVTLSLALMAVLVLLGHRMPTGTTIGIIAALGFTLAFTPVVLAHGRALLPGHLTGRGLALLNLGTMSGAFLTQWITGLLVKAIAGPALVYPVAAFQAAFALQALLLAVATLVYATAPDPRRQGARGG